MASSSYKETANNTFSDGYRQSSDCNTPTEHLLVVDSDEVIRELISYNLSSDYHITAKKTAEEALELDIAGYSLIILDFNLNGKMSGLDLIDTLQENPATAAVPFIICTACDSEDDVITGFDAGADDYIVKPFSLREMIARVKSVMRRHKIMAARQRQNAEPPRPPQNPLIVYKGLSLSPETQRLEIDGVNASLSPTEFQILKLFMKSPGKLFSREEIHAHAWGDETVSSRTIDVNISRLRKKLGIYGPSIMSRPGQGYGLI